MCDGTEGAQHPPSCPRHESSHAFVVDDVDGYVIVHPDRLISPSRITESFDCQRKAVLGEYFNSVGTPRLAPLLGTLLHEVFDSVLRARNTSDSALTAASERVIGKHLGEIMLLQDETEATVLDQMKPYFPVLRTWMGVFVASESSTSTTDAAAIRPGTSNPLHHPRRLRPGSAIPPGTGPSPQHDGQVSFSRTGDVHDSTSQRRVVVRDVVDIEDTVWSPRFGLTGKVDATVRVCVTRGTPRVPPGSMVSHGTAVSQPATTLAPLELKTGHRSGMALLSHRAQVLLYVLMLQDKHRCAVDAGLLLYLKSGDFLGVAADRADTRALLMARNAVATFLHGPARGSRGRLPHMLRSPRQCARCFQVDNCMLAHAAVEAGSEDSSGVGEEYSRRVDGLTPAHRSYFRAWYDMVMLEYGHTTTQAELWSMTGHDRELRTGQCLGALCVVHAQHAHAPPTTAPDGDVRDDPTLPPQETPYIYRFARASHCGSVSSGAGHGDASVSPVRSVSLQARKLCSGSRVVVSTNDGQTVALGMGTITGLTRDTVDVQCRGPIVGVPLVPHPCNAPLPSPALGNAHAVTNMVYRLDLDPKSFGLKMAMSNLAALFTVAPTVAPQDDDKPVEQRVARHRQRLRELIVDCKAPSVTTHPPLNDAARAALAQLSLNACQMAAIRHALRAQ